MTPQLQATAFPIPYFFVKLPAKGLYSIVPNLFNITREKEGEPGIWSHARDLHVRLQKNVGDAWTRTYHNTTSSCTTRCVWSYARSTFISSWRKHGFNGTQFAHTPWLWFSSVLPHVILDTRPSRFSVCNIEKTGWKWPGDEARSVYIHSKLHVYVQK